MQKPSPIYQYLAAVVVGLLKLSDGMLIGWVSPNLILLKSNNTILPAPLTEDEASWLPTVMPIGALAGILVYGFVTKLYGRKIPQLLLSIPAIIGWFLCCFAREVSHLYLSRFFLGFAIGGNYVVAPVYLVEIADDRIRGILGATIMVNENTGVLLGFAIGGFCDYKVLPAVGITLNLLFVILFVWFPESPAFLVSQDKILAAEKSIRFYRNLHIDDTAAVEETMERLKQAVGEADGNVNTSRLRISDVTTKPGSRAMLIAIVLVLLNQGSGVFTLMNYSAEIFQESGSFLSENLSSVIVQSIQAIGACFVAFLIEKGGRRFLYITSTLGCGFGYAVLASFSFILFISSWAVASITFSVAAELMPLKLREIGATVCAVTLSLSSFAILKLYPIMLKWIGVHGAMFIFGGICVLGAIFVIFMLPEIKGKSYEEIMNDLRGKRTKKVVVE
ncbi:facilitated trehalose transporter Tret1-like isoform X2 [Bradysia coprophila]|uniref:facilitated trehalose transporter Tret1-like isoform X2 n=1 Tax=Bradysia coprophila TaxID=38358 RepID=UPI00187D8FDC|nr:facilitated trehalose transporter Tret1-like isoform X2 [Bradysia coprophila]